MQGGGDPNAGSAPSGCVSRAREPGGRPHRGRAEYFRFPRAGATQRVFPDGGAADYKALCDHDERYRCVRPAARGHGPRQPTSLASDLADCVTAASVLVRSARAESFQVQQKGAAPPAGAGRATAPVQRPGHARHPGRFQRLGQVRGGKSSGDTGESSSRSSIQWPQLCRFRKPSPTGRNR